MRVLSTQEIHAVSGSATSDSPVNKFFNGLALGLFWTFATLFGFTLTDFI